MGNKKMNFYAAVLAIAAMGQIIMAFVLYNPEGNQLVINIGWGC